MFVLVILSLLSVTALAQADHQVTEIERYLSGRRLLVSYREGGPVYGTHVVLDVHYCANGQYVLRGESRRQTVMDNWQVNRWDDAGQWTVLRVQGRVGVRAISRSGKIDFVATSILPDSRFWAGDGVSVQPQGPARLCS